MAIDGDYGTGNDPVANQGGLTMTKQAGQFLYFSAYNNHGSFSEQFTVQETPTYSVSVFDYIG